MNRRAVRGAVRRRDGGADGGALPGAAGGGGGGPGPAGRPNGLVGRVRNEPLFRENHTTNPLAFFSCWDERKAVRPRNCDVFAESLDVSSIPDMKKFTKSLASMNIIKGALDKNFIFSSLTESEIKDSIDAMQLLNIPAGETIIAKGDNGNCFYIVESGTFTFKVNGRLVGTCEKHDSFGEVALLYSTPRAATVTAKTNSKVWVLDRVTFRSIIAQLTEAQRQECMDNLKRVPLLESLTDKQLGILADAVQVVKFDANCQILRKGQLGNIFYLITEGEVICKDVGFGKNMANRHLGPGDYFGEGALLTGEQCAANVTAVTDVTVLSLDREELQLHLDPLPDLLDRNLNMRVLSSVPVLSNLTDEELYGVVELFKPLEFDAGKTIIKQGDQGNTFYIIKSGLALVTQRAERTSGGKTTYYSIEIATLSAGDYFGEMALLNDEPRQANVIAQDKVECFVCRRDAFRGKLGPLADIMARSTATRIEPVDGEDGVVGNANRQNIAFENLQEIATLGAGTFGRVTMVQDKTTHQTYALKMMMKSEIVAHRQQQNVMNEKNILIECDHPFILKLMTTYKDPSRLYLLSELVQGGELFSLLHGGGNEHLSNNDAKFYAACVLMALGYLHQRSIAYRDLKPENLLIDKLGYCKVVDFGFAKKVANKTYTLCGTPEYLAPEIVLGRGHNMAVDYWSLGILIFEMIAGYSPYSNNQTMDQSVICRNILEKKLVFPNEFEPKCKDIVKKLLNHNPMKRLGCLKGGDQDVRTHVWFKNFNWEDMYQKKLSAPWKPNIRNNEDVSHFKSHKDGENIDSESERTDMVNDLGDWDKDF